MEQHIQSLTETFKSALKDKSAVVSKVDGSFIDFMVGEVKYRTYRTHDNELELFAVVFPNDILVTDCLSYADQLVQEQKEAARLEEIQELTERLKELKNEQ